MVAHPDYVNITYDLTIYTNFVEQLNRVIESIQYAENSYWGDKNRYYFRVNANSFSTVNSYTVDEERTVTSKITLTLHGYLIPDTVNAFMSHEMNFVSKGTVKFNEGYISSMYTIPINTKTRVNTQVVPRSGGTPPDYNSVINYLCEFCNKEMLMKTYKYNHKLQCQEKHKPPPPPPPPTPQTSPEPKKRVKREVKPKEQKTEVPKVVETTKPTFNGVVSFNDGPRVDPYAALWQERLILQQRRVKSLISQAI
jgi:hypothetical protein